MWVLDRHCNGMGFLHGGMVASFFDSCIARAIYESAGRFGVTIKLSIDYLDIVKEGTWMEALPSILAVDGDLAHAQADLITEDNRLAAQASATFMLRRNARFAKTTPLTKG